MQNETKGEAAIGLAVGAWLFLLTSIWLPWWLVRHSDAVGNRYDSVGVWLWRPVEEMTLSWAPWLTGFLAAGLALWLFVRVAGRSWFHEPTIWQRDLWAMAGLAAATLASTLLWPHPDNFAAFWGGRTFTDEAAGTSFTQSVLPGLGWWCTVVAFLCLVAAATLARSHASDASDK